MCCDLSYVEITATQKYHVQTIDIDPSLRNNTIYEQKCLENIKNLYKQAGKCDDQKKFKYILEAAIVSNPEGLTDKSPTSHSKSSPVKTPSAQRSLCMFTNVLDVKKYCLPSIWIS